MSKEEKTVNYYKARLEKKRDALASELERVNLALAAIAANPDLQLKSELLDQAGAFGNDAFRWPRNV